MDFWKKCLEYLKVSSLDCAIALLRRIGEVYPEAGQTGTRSRLMLMKKACSVVSCSQVASCHASRPKSGIGISLIFIGSTRQRPGPDASYRAQSYPAHP